MQSNFKESIFMQKGQRSDPDKVRGALRSAKAACVVQHEERILSSLAVNSSGFMQCSFTGVYIKSLARDDFHEVTRVNGEVDRF